MLLPATVPGSAPQKNNSITLNRSYQNTFGVYSNSTHSASAVTTAASATSINGGNSGLKVYSNTISNVNQGIVVVGPVAVADMNTGIDIGGTGSNQGNVISNFGSTSGFSSFANVTATVNGILVRNCLGFNISYNNITSSTGFDRCDCRLSQWYPGSCRINNSRYNHSLLHRKQQYPVIGQLCTGR